MAINQPPIVGPGFAVNVSETDPAGATIATFGWVDADSSSWALSITSGNPDLDGDLDSAFEVVQVGPTTAEIRIKDADDVDFGLAGQVSTLTMTVNDQEPLNPGSATLVVSVTTMSRFTQSNRVGDLMITEVLWASHEFSGNPEKDQFIELTNTSGTAMNLAGWRLTDAEDPANPGEFESFSLTFPNHTLAAGDRVVVWPGTPGGTRATDPSIQSFWNGDLGALAKTDDLWLFDPAGSLVAYVAWGNDGNANPANDDFDEIGDRPPTVAYGLWDPTYESNLGTGTSIGAGQSLSLTPDSDLAASVLSGCWEPTGSDEANGRCPEGALDTVVNDPVSTRREASPGFNNN